LLSTDFFYNGWLEYDIDDPNIGIRSLKTNIGYDFFDNLRFDSESLKSYRVNAARLISKTLGDRPALCLSGGVDSQAMIYCWLEAGLKFDVVSCIFHNNLNLHDVDTARDFCKIHGLNLIEIPLNVIQFLNRENIDYAIKYKSSSPHFNVHYKLFNMLQDMGYSGACCGGVALFKDGDSWGTNFRYNIFNFINYVKESKFNVQGSFLSYYPELAWSVGLLTKDMILPTNGMPSNELFNSYDEIRYSAKVDGYHKAGLKVIPQKKGYTGFEEVKKYYESITKDGWEFEKRFRHSIQNIHKTHKNKAEIVKLNLSKDLNDKILSIYSNNMTSC